MLVESYVCADHHDEERKSAAANKVINSEDNMGIKLPDEKLNYGQEEEDEKVPHDEELMALKQTIEVLKKENAKNKTMIQKLEKEKLKVQMKDGNKQLKR